MVAAWAGRTNLSRVHISITTKTLRRRSKRTTGSRCVAGMGLSLLPGSGMPVIPRTQRGTVVLGGTAGMTGHLQHGGQLEVRHRAAENCPVVPQDRRIALGGLDVHRPAP